jgi:hypothetical protein
VFEAVGRLWLKPLPSGAVRRLTNDTTAAVELTPAWSPDGASVVFATWSDETGGHLWLVPAAGGSAHRLTRQAGRFLFPSGTPDGASILATRWAPAITLVPGSPAPAWETVRLASTGGDGEVIGRRGPFRRTPPDPRGRVYALDGTRLRVQRHAVNAAIDPAVLTPGDALVVPSPDGRWVAVQRLQDVYLAPMPSGLGNADSGTAEIEGGEAGFRRLSTEGGTYPRWRNTTTVEFVGANRYFAHRADRGTTDTVAIEFTVPRDPPRGTVALTGARIVTLDRKRVIESGTVLVTGSRITCVGRCDARAANRVVDVRGKTIVPGWVDVHAHHLSAEPDGIIPPHRAPSARYLAWGVTTVHDPAATVDHSYAIGELIEAGRITGPRTFSTGIVITCSEFDDLRDIVTYQDAREHVTRAVSQGAISIKDYKQCTRSQRQMLIEASRKLGVTITSEGSDPLYLLGLIMTGSTGWEHPIQYHPLYSDLARFMGMAGAHYSPQLILSDYPHGSVLEYWMGREDLWRNPKVMRWTPWQEVATRRTFVNKPWEEYIFPIVAQGAAAIRRAGGYLAVGDHGEQAGLGSHWEVWSYASALPPMDALEVASQGGAHFLGLEAEIGSITPGKLADLVVLNRNPLDNIRFTTDIAFVMKGGKLYRGETLDEVWPRRRPYGVRPWNPPEMLRDDGRADDYWDRPVGAPIQRKP